MQLLQDSRINDDAIFAVPMISWGISRACIGHWQGLIRALTLPLLPARKPQPKSNPELLLRRSRIDTATEELLPPVSEVTASS